MALAMAIADNACFSFIFSSNLSKRSIVTRKSATYQKSSAVCSKWGYTCTRLFSSAAPSSDSTGNTNGARSSTFSTPQRNISEDESKKYKELMGASKLQLAPMMEYTDRHFRHLVRLVSGKTLLYTEMVAANALAYERAACIEEYRRSVAEDSSTSQSPSEQDVRENYSDHYLQRYLNQGHIEPLEGPSVLQLGGSDPAQLYEAAETVMDMVSFSEKMI
jgi:hypothetical protein